MGRWLIVRVIARGLRGGVSDTQAAEMLRKHFRHRDVEWRAAVLASARIRNARKAHA